MAILDKWSAKSYIIAFNEVSFKYRISLSILKYDYGF
jgi:hypothetical protein